MRSARFTLWITFVLITFCIFFQGCATPKKSTDYLRQNPIDYERIEGRDAEIAEAIRTNDSGRQATVAIIPEIPRKKGKTENALQKCVFDNLDVAITGLRKFEVVPRSDIAAIVNEKKVQGILSDGEIKLPSQAPRYLMIYNVIYSNFESRTLKFIDPAALEKEMRKAKKIEDSSERTLAYLTASEKATKEKQCYVGFAKIKMTIYDSKLGKRIYAQTLSGYSTNSEHKAGNIGLLNEAIENIVRDYMVQFATDFAPPAVVEMTKGGGQIALLSIGRKEGILIGTEIEFINYLERGKKTLVVPYARGKVFEIDDESCWVAVENHAKVHVRENALARVKPTQSKSSRINSL